MTICEEKKLSKIIDSISDSIAIVVEFAQFAEKERRFLVFDCPHESDHYTDEDRDNFKKEEKELKKGLEIISLLPEALQAICETSKINEKKQHNLNSTATREERSKVILNLLNWKNRNAIPLFGKILEWGG